MAAGSSGKIPAIDAVLTSEGYPTGTYPMTFITNHDENSWNGTEYERLGTAVKMLSAFYFTAPGMPLIYSGQEVALNKRLKFFEKDEIVWKASPMTAFYQKLVAMKSKNSALNTDMTPAPTKFLSATNYYTPAYGRADGKNKVFVVLNLSRSKVTTTVTSGVFAGTYYDVFTGKAMKVSPKHKVTLPGHGYLVLSSVK
jgi:glycosidase